jgi:hypothetical protein
MTEPRERAVYVTSPEPTVVSKQARHKDFIVDILGKKCGRPTTLGKLLFYQ